jgi:hypothetical protein
MKKSKFLLALCMMVLCAAKTQAQDEEVVQTNRLFELFSKLSDNIDKFVDKQEAKRLYRHLDYFKNDMNRYLVVRKEITGYLEARNYSSFDTLKVEEAVFNLEIQILKLGKRLEVIKAYADKAFSDDIDEIVDDIGVGVQEQRVKYINKLKGLSEGEKVNKAQIKKDGIVIYKKLQSSISMINKIKSKLKAKFGF